MASGLKSSGFGFPGAVAGAEQALAMFRSGGQKRQVPRVQLDWREIGDSLLIGSRRGQQPQLLIVKGPQSILLCPLSQALIGSLNRSNHSLHLADLVK